MVKYVNSIFPRSLAQNLNKRNYGFFKIISTSSLLFEPRTYETKDKLPLLLSYQLFKFNFHNIILI